jgi:cytochrome c oxidase subunit 2
LHAKGLVRCQTPTQRAVRCTAISLCVLASAACDGPQSALDPAGLGAARVADLTAALTAGATVIWCATIGLALYAMYGHRRPAGQSAGSWLIVGGGVALPVVVLAGTLSYGLALLPPLLPAATEGRLEIEVTGEQWWWRVRYLPAGESPVDLANELHLPAGEPVELALSSDNVIHSLWIPVLAGKADMIPGRRIRLALEPTEPGVYRGVCAEYCGTSHALMAFRVVVHERPEFEAWLQRQRAPAAEPRSDLAAAGAEGFLGNGCGACHTVRGTLARGTVGPDLTHVGSRLSLGAGTLPNDAAAFGRWLALTEEIKPGVHMPAFGMLPAGDIRALAAYLEELQ